MNITPTPATSGTNPNPTPSSSNNNGTISGNEFISLLTAELKDQDPTNPMDPTQFVSQMVQFNSLEQLISINQDLTPATPSGSGSGSTSNPAPSAPTQP